MDYARKDLIFIIGEEYSVCTGTLYRRVTFRGMIEKHHERLLLFENENPEGSSYRFMAGKPSLEMPYSNNLTVGDGVEIYVHLGATYYGHSMEGLARHGIQDKWKMAR